MRRVRGPSRDPASYTSKRGTRRGLLACFGALAGVTLIGLVVAALTLEVDRVSIGRSLASETGSAYFNACRPAAKSEWHCTVQDGEEEAHGDYRVRKSGRWCWTAHQFDRPGATKNELPAQIDGCVGPDEALKEFVDLGPDRYDAP